MNWPLEIQHTMYKMKDMASKVKQQTNQNEKAQHNRTHPLEAPKTPKPPKKHNQGLVTYVFGEKGRQTR